jgi:hypothetical protein
LRHSRDTSRSRKSFVPLNSGPPFRPSFPAISSAVRPLEPENIGQQQHDVVVFYPGLVCNAEGGTSANGQCAKAMCT